MAQDVFGIDRNIGQAWNLDGAVISFGDRQQGDPLDDLIVTSVNLAYRRSTSQITPLNSSLTHVISGESNGTLSLGTIIGPTGTIKNFLEDFGKICGFEKRVIVLKPTGAGTYTDSNGNCATSEKSNAQSFVCEGCLINNFGMSVSNGGGGITVVNANVTLQILKLTVDNNSR